MRRISSNYNGCNSSTYVLSYKPCICKQCAFLFLAYSFTLDCKTIGELLQLVIFFCWALIYYKDSAVPCGLLYTRFISSAVTHQGLVIWDRGKYIMRKSPQSLQRMTSPGWLYHQNFFKYLHCLCAMFVETKICEKATYLTIGLPSVQRKSLSNILSFSPIHWLQIRSCCYWTCLSCCLFCTVACF